MCEAASSCLLPCLSQPALPEASPTEASPAAETCDVGEASMRMGSLPKPACLFGDCGGVKGLKLVARVPRSVRPRCSGSSASDELEA